MPFGDAAEEEEMYVAQGTQLWYSPFKGKHDVGMLFHE
jgi:hypothetical protein